MITIISNVANADIIATFINSSGPEINLVYYYLQINSKHSIYLSPFFDINLWIEKLQIVSKISANGDKIAFSELLNLFARQKNKFIY